MLPLPVPIMQSSGHASPAIGPAECFNSPRSAEPIPESVCHRQIERIIGSVTFARAEQLRQLLHWLGGRALEQLAVSPSEREIAATVLNRKDFDPQTDSLVRKEMSRLREKLTRYYLSEGRLDEVRITFGNGYLPAFERWAHLNPNGARACWLMLPFRTEASLSDLGEELLDEFLMAFGERSRAKLVAPTTAIAYRGRSGDVRQFAAECSADFVVEGSLRRRDALLEVMTWLIDGQSGRSLRSKRITGTTVLDLARSATAWLLEENSAV